MLRTTVQMKLPALAKSRDYHFPLCMVPAAQMSRPHQKKIEGQNLNTQNVHVLRFFCALAQNSIYLPFFVFVFVFFFVWRHKHFCSLLAVYYGGFVPWRFPRSLTKLVGYVRKFLSFFFLLAVLSHVLNTLCDELILTRCKQKSPWSKRCDQCITNTTALTDSVYFNKHHVFWKRMSQVGALGALVHAAHPSPIS